MLAGICIRLTVTNKNAEVREKLFAIARDLRIERKRNEEAYNLLDVVIRQLSSVIHDERGIIQ
jgi:hypothetical protein